MPRWLRKEKGTVESQDISCSGKPDAVKAACPVWTGGKAVRPYLSVQLTLSVQPKFHRRGKEVRPG